MEETLEQLWTFTLWGFGTCAAGFFVLLGITLKTAGKMTKPVEQIRDALVGTFDQPGLITRHYKLEEDIKNFKKKCDNRHQKA